MSDIVKFEFHGNVLDCVKEGEDLWVSVRRMCEPLGIADRPQREKLHNKSWARGTLIVSPDARGRNQSQFFLHIDSVPMWLATIDENRVAEEVRPMLVKFQLEAAKVLRDHFFGAPKTPTNFAEALRLAADTEEARQRSEEARQLAEKKVEADRPKVEFAMAVKEADNVLTLGEMSRVLNNTGVKIGRNRLISWMCDENILLSYNKLPYQRYVELGYFVVSESTYEAKGRKRTGLSTRVTGKGQTWLEKRFRESKGYDPINSTKHKRLKA